MKDASKILPCAIKPEKDELFSSWLIRLSNAHLSGIVNFYKDIYPYSNIWKMDIDTQAPEKLIKKLEEITFSTYEEIFSTTLKSYEGRLFLEMMYSNKTKWILPHSTPHTTTINSSVAFCPSCFKKDENPYFRKHWRLSIAILCTECSVYLQDKCPACNEPIKFDTTGFTIKNGHYEHSFKNCFNCQFDLSKAPVQLAPTKYLKKQIELYRIIKEGWNEKVIYPHLYFDVLHHILKLIKGKELFLINTLEDFKVPFEQSPIKVRIKQLIIAIWILEDFPKRFIRIIPKENLIPSILFRKFKTVPFWYYNTFLGNFYISNIDKPF